MRKEVKNDGSGFDDVLDIAKTGAAQWYGFQSNNIYEGQKDATFLYLSQFDPDEINDLKNNHKTLLQVNKIYDHFKKVAGEEEQNEVNYQFRPRMNVDPGQTDQRITSAYAGIMRSIWYNSKGEEQKNATYRNMMSKGMGAIEVSSEYEMNSFDQGLKFKATQEPELCFFDTAAESPTKEDGDFCGKIAFMAKDTVDEQYEGFDNIQSFPVFNGVSSNRYFFSTPKNTVAICTWHQKEWFNEVIVELDNGEIVTKDEYEDLEKQYYEYVKEIDYEALLRLPNFPMIVRKRTQRNYKIITRVLSGNYELDKTECPSRELPIVFFPGERVMLNGQEYLFSFIHYAKDAQRVVNFMNIELVSAIKNSRKEAAYATPKMVEGNEEQWRTPELQRGAILFNPDERVQGGAPIPFQQPPVNPSIGEQYQRSTLDIQSILGRYGESQGQGGSDPNARAEALRISQSNLGSQNFTTNLDAGLNQLGRVLASAIPVIYDTNRFISYETPNKKQSAIEINRPMPDGSLENDISSAKDKIEPYVERGASYKVQKQEALNSIIGIIQASGNPQNFNLVADLIAANTDLQNTPQLVKRFQKLVPPDILAEENGEPPPPQQPPQPTIEEQIKMADLEIKKKELQQTDQEMAIRQDENKIQATRTILEAQKIRNDEMQTQLKTNAEIERAAYDHSASIASSKASVLSSMAKIATAQHKIQKAQESQPTGRASNGRRKKTGKTNVSR
jgi:hypothetical protein